MTSGVGTSIFNEDKNRNLRLYHMTNYEAPKVLYQFLQWGTPNKDPNVTFDIYLHETRGYSKLRIRNFINSDQRNQVKNDPLGSSFDLSLLCQVIPVACEGLLKSYPWVLNVTEATLLSSIYEMKTFRNKFMHSNSCSLDDKSFCAKTEILRELLIKIVNMGAKLYEIDKEKHDQCIKLLNENINKSRDDAIENWDITNYENQIIFIEKKKLLLTEGKGQLIEKYKYFSQVSPASFLTGSNIHLEVGVVFTQLEIVESGSRNSITEISYNEILEVALNATIDNGSKTDVLLIEGIAGAGKTTLTKLMMSQWQAGESCFLHLLDYDLLIYFECRNSATESFTQLLEKLIPNATSKFREGDLKKCVLSLKLLIIADGLDELNKSSKKVLQEILDLGDLTFVTIVCTSRPECVKTFYQMIPNDQYITHVKIKGIPKNKRTDFVIKYHNELKRLGLSKQDTNGLAEYLNTSERQLEEHWRLPLNLVLLSISWADTPYQINEVTGATKLYTKFTYFNKQRLIKRLRTHEKTFHFHPDELEEKVNRFFLHLSWEALINLKDENIEALTNESVERLKDVCSTLELPYESVLSAFLVEGITYKDADAKSIFSIPHKGLQDYMAASYIIQALNGNDLRFDISSIMKSIQSHPSFCTESLRQDFIYHIMKFLGNILHGDTSTVCLTKASNSESSSYIEHQERPTSIYNVLEGLYGIKEVPSDLRRYQNTFAYTAGLLHLIPSIIRTNIANEIVNLFLQSGVRDRDLWFDFIKEMENLESVMKSIAKLVPNLVNGAVNITDERTDIYSKLLPHAEPKAVRINIANNTDEIPNLEILLRDLAKKSCCSAHIHFNHNFKNATAPKAELDEALTSVFKSTCSVKRFMGRLSKTSAEYLPVTIERLAVVVDEENASAMKQVFMKLKEEASTLTALSVHVVPRVDPDILISLPGNGDLILFLSDIAPSAISWACKVAKNLQPEGSSHFNNIMFPRCQLTTEEVCQLLQEMKSHQVKISRDGIFGGVSVASSKISHVEFQTLRDFAKDTLGCVIRLSLEEEIWPKVITESSKSRRQDPKAKK